MHQAGRQPEAEALFAEAEAMQAEWQAQYPLLYSLQGFRYCDLRLGGAERAAWRGWSSRTAGRKRSRFFNPLAGAQVTS